MARLGLELEDRGSVRFTQEVHINYLDDGIAGSRITYRHDGAIVASEVIDLVR